MESIANLYVVFVGFEKEYNYVNISKMCHTIKNYGTAVRDVSWEYPHENILREREYSENIPRKIILRVYLRFSQKRTL
jgi:hypothetical protein